jgi:hypothetical protein
MSRAHATVLASAARALAEVAARGRSADDALAPFRHAADRSAIRAITLGSLRWYWRLLPAVVSLAGERRALAPALRALLIPAAHHGRQRFARDLHEGAQQRPSHVEGTMV